MNVVVEEADETVFWLEFIADTKILPLKTRSSYQRRERVAGDLRGFSSNGKTSQRSVKIGAQS